MPCTGKKRVNGPQVHVTGVIIRTVRFTEERQVYNSSAWPIERKAPPKDSTTTRDQPDVMQNTEARTRNTDK
jgi:hypothetical protein